MTAYKASALLILVYCAIHGCSDEVSQPAHMLCDDPHDPGCVLLRFRTLEDGMVVGRANDLDHALAGVQYDITFEMSRAMLGGTLSLTRNGESASYVVQPTNNGNHYGFAAYTLVMGPNQLTAELKTGDGLLVDRVSITIYVE